MTARQQAWIWPIAASAIIERIGDAKQFRTGGDLAAWLGLTPLKKSNGGKRALGQDHTEGRTPFSQAVGCRNDIALCWRNALRKGESVDSHDHCGQTMPIGNDGDGQQSSSDHLGDANEETRIPATSVLTTPPEFGPPLLRLQRLMSTVAGTAKPVGEWSEIRRSAFIALAFRNFACSTAIHSMLT